jgi:hypothetical protein
VTAGLDAERDRRRDGEQQRTDRSAEEVVGDLHGAVEPGVGPVEAVRGHE